MSNKSSSLLQRGISLIELIMFIVIISVALAGILLVMNQVMSRSADPLVRKQALAIAESMLEEIQLHDLAAASCTGALLVDASRIGAGCVADYGGYSTVGGPLVGILDFSTNTPVPGLEGYDITGVTVTPLATFGGTVISSAVGAAYQIDVTVSDPTGIATNNITVTGYRAGQ